MKYKAIDLCAGIGGLRRGFELTGQFENVLSAEIYPYVVQTYKHLFGEKETPLSDLVSNYCIRNPEFIAWIIWMLIVLGIIDGRK